MSCVKELDGELSLTRLRNQCDFGYKYLQNVSQQHNVSPVFASPCKDGTNHCSESQHSESRGHLFQDQLYFDSPTHVNCCGKSRGEIDLQEMTSNSDDRSYLTPFQEQNYRQFFQQQFSNFSHQRHLSDFALKSSLPNCASSYSETNKMVPPPAHQGPQKLNPQQQQQELAKTYRIEKYSELQQQQSNELFNSNKAEKLKFPWMKTTKSHAKQWKSNWMGLCSTLKFKIFFVILNLSSQ